MSPQLAYSSAVSVMTMAAFALSAAPASADSLHKTASASPFGLPVASSMLEVLQPGKWLAELR